MCHLRCGSCESNCCAQGSRFMAPAVVCPAAVTQRAPLAGSSCSCNEHVQQLGPCLQLSILQSRFLLVCRQHPHVSPHHSCPFQQPSANQTAGKGPISVLLQEKAEDIRANAAAQLTIAVLQVDGSWGARFSPACMSWWEGLSRHQMASRSAAGRAMLTPHQILSDLGC